MYTSYKAYLNVWNTFDTKIIVGARFTRENSVWLWADKIFKHFLSVQKKVKFHSQYDVHKNDDILLRMAG